MKKMNYFFSTGYANPLKAGNADRRFWVVSTTKPRTYSCDQLGICNCQGAPCTSCSPQPPSRLERAGLAALKLVTLVVTAGASGWVWGTYGQGLTDLFLAMAALKS